tara:strand:- start:4041 stop:4298 length:258 start_codon:yes stop_codon:yes gene_type:complete
MNYYEILGVPQNSTLKEINDRFKQISDAHIILSNPDTRTAYDKILTEYIKRRTCSPSRNAPPKKEYKEEYIEEFNMRLAFSDNYI